MTKQEIISSNKAIKNEIASVISEQIDIQNMKTGIVLKAISTNERPTSNTVLEGVLTGKSYRIDTLLSTLAILGVKLTLTPTYNAQPNKAEDNNPVADDLPDAEEDDLPFLDMPGGGPDNRVGEQGQEEPVGSGDGEHTGPSTT